MSEIEAKRMIITDDCRRLTKNQTVGRPISKHSLNYLTLKRALEEIRKEAMHCMDGNPIGEETEFHLTLTVVRK